GPLRLRRCGRCSEAVCRAPSDLRFGRATREIPVAPRAALSPGTLRPMGPGFATAMGLSVAAGFNAWATVLVFSGCARIFPDLFPGALAAFLRSGPVFTLALALFVAEFLADKIPHLEHFWNFAQTLLRPAAGAAMAAACVPGRPLAVRAGVAVLG